MSMMMKPREAACCLLLALVLTACNSDNQPAATASGTASAPATGTSPAKPNLHCAP